MKLAVINLAADSERWAAIARQFRSLSLQPLRIDAVDGQRLSAAKRDALYSVERNRQLYHKPLCAAEIGCYASHVAVWRSLVQSDDSAVAVFEDDVQLQQDLPLVLTAVERTRIDWDLIKLIGRPREKLHARLPFMRERALIRYRRVPGLTSAYVIHRKAAQKLLARRLPFGRPIDIDLRHWWECELTVLGVHPYPVHLAPTSEQSTMTDRRVPLSADVRAKKFAQQLQYSWRNWWAVQALPGTARGRPPVTQFRRAADLPEHAG